MVQDVIVFLLFVGALVYIGYLLYQNFRPGSGCASGCGSCGIDIAKIRKQLEEKGLR